MDSFILDPRTFMRLDGVMIPLRFRLAGCAAVGRLSLEPETPANIEKPTTAA